MTGGGTDGQLRRITTLFLRALRLRCPSCGGHPIILRWFMVSDNCPVCGIRLQRGEQGYWVGAYMFNLIAAELVWAGSMVAVVWWTWPDPPWTGLLVGGVILMVAAPVVFVPLSRLVFFAFDLVFRPPQPDDYPDH